MANNPSNSCTISSASHKSSCRSSPYNIRHKYIQDGQCTNINILFKKICFFFQTLLRFLQTNTWIPTVQCRCCTLQLTSRRLAGHREVQSLCRRWSRSGRPRHPRRRRPPRVWSLVILTRLLAERQARRLRAHALFTCRRRWIRTKSRTTPTRRVGSIPLSRYSSSNSSLISTWIYTYTIRYRLIRRQVRWCINRWAGSIRRLPLRLLRITRRRIFNRVLRSCTINCCICSINRIHPPPVTMNNPRNTKLCMPSKGIRRMGIFNRRQTGSLLARLLIIDSRISTSKSRITNRRVKNIGALDGPH